MHLCQVDKNVVNTEMLECFEGCDLVFLGDTTCGLRRGYIHEIIIEEGEVFAYVIWDDDEFIGVENGKPIYCYDSGSCTYPMDVIMNKKRFKLDFNNNP